MLATSNSKVYHQNNKKNYANHGIESLNYLEIYQFAFDLSIDHTTATNNPILDHSKVALVMQITFFEKKNQIYHQPKI